jgi:hypothetical protein
MHAYIDFVIIMVPVKNHLLCLYRRSFSMYRPNIMQSRIVDFLVDSLTAIISFHVFFLLFSAHSVANYKGY